MESLPSWNCYRPGVVAVMESHDTLMQAVLYNRAQPFYSTPIDAWKVIIAQLNEAEFIRLSSTCRFFRALWNDENSENEKRMANDADAIVHVIKTVFEHTAQTCTRCNGNVENPRHCHIFMRSECKHLLCWDCEESGHREACKVCNRSRYSIHSLDTVFVPKAKRLDEITDDPRCRRWLNYNMRMRRLLSEYHSSHGKEIANRLNLMWSFVKDATHNRLRIDHALPWALT